MLLSFLTTSSLFSLGIDARFHNHADEAVAITAPPAASSSAFPLVDRDFAGFAFEERSFYYYFGILTNLDC